jgi:PPK2 family polyphosphate:nucleotide phosphotransferase
MEEIHLPAAPSFHRKPARGSAVNRKKKRTIMSNYLKELIAEPGSKIRLKHFDPAYHDKHESRKSALPEIEEDRQKMQELQYLMYAENKHSFLIVLQGLDAGGKDGVVRHVFTGMNPSGCVAVNFKQPTAQDLAHDFLWRVHPHVPAKGSVAIFNRSHYEDVLVARVHGLVPEKVWSKRYDQINDFEQLISTENNTTILKFFLHISKDEQLARFKKRLDDPARQWKISESDYKEREYWDDYIKAFEDVLTKTSTKHAPWFIIPSNHKWFRNLSISQIIARTMEEMDMQFPKPTVNLSEIRRNYHQAVDEKKSGRSKKQ